jgi:hypothetical protein
MDAASAAMAGSLVRQTEINIMQELIIEPGRAERNCWRGPLARHKQTTAGDRLEQWHD